MVCKTALIQVIETAKINGSNPIMSALNKYEETHNIVYANQLALFFKTPSHGDSWIWRMLHPKEHKANESISVYIKEITNKKELFQRFIENDKLKYYSNETPEMVSALSKRNREKAWIKINNSFRDVDSYIQGNLITEDIPWSIARPPFLTEDRVEYSRLREKFRREHKNELLNKYNSMIPELMKGTYIGSANYHKLHRIMEDNYLNTDSFYEDKNLSNEVKDELKTNLHLMERLCHPGHLEIYHPYIDIFKTKDQLRYLYAWRIKLQDNKNDTPERQEAINAWMIYFGGKYGSKYDLPEFMK